MEEVHQLAADPRVYVVKRAHVPMGYEATRFPRHPAAGAEKRHVGWHHLQYWPTSLKANVPMTLPAVSGTDTSGLKEVTAQYVHKSLRQSWPLQFSEGFCSNPSFTAKSSTLCMRDQLRMSRRFGRMPNGPIFSVMAADTTVKSVFERLWEADESATARAKDEAYWLRANLPARHEEAYAETHTTDTEEAPRGQLRGAASAGLHSRPAP